ncbi:MAG: Cysteine/O-acetylserine efflux protein [Chlamydiia bacterium]|nr:Cysteine/O-acetylserine efflux protein [Chlamydiia bacterium]
MIHLFQFIFFAFSAMITPGPNNLMIMHSGLNFGYKRSMPHFFGIISGVGVMLFAVAFGFGYAFEKIPSLKLIIRVIGSLYMLYLAWKISQMNEKKTDTNIAKPLTFMQAALFQWVNPKAWVICISFTSMFHLSDEFMLNAALLLLTISIINFPCLLIWMSFGKGLEKIINSEKQRTRLNVILALLLVLSILILWI